MSKRKIPKIKVQMKSQMKKVVILKANKYSIKFYQVYFFSNFHPIKSLLNNFTFLIIPPSPLQNKKNIKFEFYALKTIGINISRMEI